MIDLLMLGIVPGTNIQINFGDWLTITAFFAALVLLVLTIRYRALIVTVLLLTLRNNRQQALPSDLRYSA